MSQEEAARQQVQQQQSTLLLLQLSAVRRPKGQIHLAAKAELSLKASQCCLKSSATCGGREGLLSPVEVGSLPFSLLPLYDSNPPPLVVLYICCSLRLHIVREGGTEQLPASGDDWHRPC
jgi:hypothetical protein